MLKSKLRVLTILLILIVTACSPAAPEADVVLIDTAVPPQAAAPGQPTEAAPTTEVPMVNLPDLGPAAEFKNETWLNAAEPVSLASLRGKVVLLEFWTFG